MKRWVALLLGLLLAAGAACAETGLPVFPNLMALFTLPDWAPPAFEAAYEDGCVTLRMADVAKATCVGDNRIEMEYDAEADVWKAECNPTSEGMSIDVEISHPMPEGAGFLESDASIYFVSGEFHHAYYTDALVFESDNPALYAFVDRLNVPFAHYNFTAFAEESYLHYYADADGVWQLKDADFTVIYNYFSDCIAFKTDGHGNVVSWRWITSDRNDGQNTLMVEYDAEGLWYADYHQPGQNKTYRFDRGSGWTDGSGNPCAQPEAFVLEDYLLPYAIDASAAP